MGDNTIKRRIERDVTKQRVNHHRHHRVHQNLNDKEDQQLVVQKEDLLI